ncbi:MAG: sigma-70 family RNA polymerase sigma factor [Phycisphaerales bacterium]|nr:sigma-70 family RNA polymerase sigma factor [Phycisphaerales bacterium]MCI0674626.1 sigma-70 family RNA polymerase sigma factor [Phycisphaerales bacterium]
MSQQDWVLMHRVAAGEDQAVAELYDRFGSLVYKVARQFLPTQAEAEDAVQEIFVRLWQTADRYDPRRAKLVTWVMLIARRHLIDRIRRSAVRPGASAFDGEMACDAPDNVPDRQSQVDERSVKLRKRIAELPELQRVVIERAYLQGFTLREVSEQLNAPLGTVKSALSRGLERLRERAQADWAM